MDGKRLCRLKVDWMNSKNKINHVLENAKIPSLSLEVPK